MSTLFEYSDAMTLVSGKKALEDLSILVSCYNKEEFISSFINEIRPLIESGAEIVVINDGSTDNSISLLQEISSDCHLISTSNLGVAQARNSAMDASTRPYLIFLDIDDSLSLEPLKVGLAKIRQDGGDLMVSAYVRIQDGLVSPSPVEKTTDINSSAGFQVRSQIMHGMGFWRYIYSRSFIEKNRLRFFPTFQEMNGNFFILDDLFWMIHLCGVIDLELLVNDSDLPLYKYNYEIPQPEYKWTSFVRQIILIPDAFLLFEDVLLSCNHKHEARWLIQAGQNALSQHLNYLDFMSFLRAIPALIKFIKKSNFFYSDGKISKGSRLLFGSGRYAFRNSVALVKKRFLFFYERIQGKPK
jgi:glycosyltransferase involved in cell wall biosynthesis